MTYDILGLRELASERDGRVLTELRTPLKQGDVPGFTARLETFIFGFAHENLQGEANFRVLMQALFRLMELPAQAEHSNGRTRRPFGACRKPCLHFRGEVQPIRP